MAAANYFWSWVWTSPLQKTLSDIQMHDLKEDATPLTIGLGSFGVVTKLTDKNKTTVYIGRKLPENNAFSDAATKKAALQLFPEMVLQLCGLRHSNIVQMQGIFFSDSVSYLPTLVYEELTRSTWITLDCYLLTNRSELDKVTILEHVASGRGVCMIKNHLHPPQPSLTILATVREVRIITDKNWQCFDDRLLKNQMTHQQTITQHVNFGSPFQAFFFLGKIVNCQRLDKS